MSLSLQRLMQSFDQHNPDQVQDYTVPHPSDHLPLITICMIIHPYTFHRMVSKLMLQSYLHAFPVYCYMLSFISQELTRFKTLYTLTSFAKSKSIAFLQLIFPITSITPIYLSNLPRPCFLYFLSPKLCKFHFSILCHIHQLF